MNFNREMFGFTLMMLAALIGGVSIIDAIVWFINTYGNMIYLQWESCPIYLKIFIKIFVSGILGFYGYRLMSKKWEV